MRVTSHAIVVASVVAGLLAISPDAICQKQDLDKFQTNKASASLRIKSEVTDFASRNNIPVSFKSKEGNHFYLSEIRKGRPIYRMTLNAEAAITTNVSGLRSNAGLGFNLQGNGMLVGIFDNGIVKDHIELGGRVISKEGDKEENHATHVTGTIISAGINPAAQGMAPKANAATFYFGDDEQKMAVLAEPDQKSLLFSNHSYGEVTGWYKSNNVWTWAGDATISSDEDFRFGFYGERARSLDELAHLAPYYSIIWAAGNDRNDAGNATRLPDCNGGTGYDCIIPDAVAKNVLTVGAVSKVLNYNIPSNVQMSSFSSWGPTDDGRIKPDVVGAGVNLLSLSADGTNTYTTLSGTSMAAPNVTGSLLLLQELYSKLHGGNFMRAATIKALAIHTAREAGSFPGPDYSFGWGLVNATAAAQLLRDEDDQQVMVLERSLLNGQTLEWELHPKANQKLTITLAWTDPPGTPVKDVLDPANIMLVNDLDMRLTDELGAQQFPWILDPINPAKKASHGDNFRDNVEKIEFDLPLEKKYKLSISHKGLLAGNRQDFSLIITYQAADPLSKTYYWIGDSGNWSDINHWSFTSGGTTALLIPAVTDKVIIDENSFDGTGNDLITLTGDVTVASLLWMNSKPSGIGFNGKSLTINKRLTFGFDTFLPSGSGIFRLKNNGTEVGHVSIKKTTLPGVSFVADGNWDLSGNVDLDQLTIEQGNFSAPNSILALNRLDASGTASKEIDLTKTQLILREGSDFVSNLVVHSDSSKLTTSNDVTLNWNNIDFSGEIISESGSLKINGNNHFSKVTVQDKSEWTGIINIDELVVQPGAHLLLGNGAELRLTSKAKLSGSDQKPVTLSSDTKGALSFSDHYKYCYDFLNVTNVDVKNSVVNAGLNSHVTTSNNWQQKNCEDVLFADFKFKYNCVNGITEFTDTSGGQPDQWLWNFDNRTTSSLQNTNYQYMGTGEYLVSLTISKSGVTQSYTTNIVVQDNTIPANTIAINNGTLTSLLVAEKYQWYVNGEVIKDATQRSYSTNGTEGLYFVVVYKDQCNLPSDSVTVTGLEVDSNADVSIYPNPVFDRLKIESPAEIEKIEILNATGQTVLNQVVREKSINVDVKHFPSSIYFVRVLTVMGETRKRILIGKFP